MLATGIALLVIGLVAAIACFFWKRSSQKSSGWWASVEDMDVATALASPAGSAVAVCGATVAPRTEAGAALADPVHGKECCWWQETVTEHWEERVRVTGNKDENAPDHRWEQRSNQISERASGLPFTVSDGAQISVDLRDIDIDGDLLQESTDQRRQGTGEGIAEALVDGLLSGGSGRRDRYTETRIQTLPVGTRVLVSGRTAGATIVADAECGLQVCEGTVESRLGDSLRSAKRAHLGLVIGSGLTVAGAVLAAAGAAA